MYHTLLLFALSLPLAFQQTPAGAPLAVTEASPGVTQTSPSTQIYTNSPAERPVLTAQDRGDIFMARKMYREAVDMYKQAPETAIVVNKIGIAYHQLSDLPTAERYYARAAKLDPKFVEAINNLGTIYYSKQSYRRAISQYKKVLRIKPSSAPTLANLASAYFARKQYDLATDTLDRALAIDPNVLESRGGAGAIVRERSVGDRPTFFYTLAKSYAKKGLNDRAVDYIRKALEEGFKERDKFIKEPEFAGLRDDPEFKKLMATEPKVL